jgi:anaerobic magnesium-protoporphyrin IX monomethyl ester cyclase
MRVALVVPNFRWTLIDEITYWHFLPYNLFMIAAMIEHDHEVKIIDANLDKLSETDFQQILREFKPEVVGVTVLMNKYGVTGHKTLQLAKEVSPNITTVFGGVYATTNPDHVMEDLHVDYTVVGEGEYAFRSLLGYLEGKETRLLAGVWHRHNGAVVQNGRAELIVDLDKLPLPSYHLGDFNRYANSVERHSVDGPPALPYGQLTTSRGCAQRCVFCQVKEIAGPLVRQRSAANVLQELAWLKSKYQIKSFIVTDDNFMANKKRAKEILQLIVKENLHLPWKMLGTAIFMLDDEIIELLAASGCVYVDLAIESGTPRVLRDIVQKPVNLETAPGIVQRLQAHQIYVAANFIVGFPGETWNEIRQTIKYAGDMGVDYVKLFNAVPLPKTRLYDLCVQQNALVPNYDPLRNDWKHGLVETSEFTLKDLSILRAYEWDRINFTDESKRKKTAAMMNISMEELQRIRRSTLDSLKI